MPEMFASICRDRGTDCVADSVTAGGFSLEDFLSDGNEYGLQVKGLLSNKKYDYVIIQEQSLRPAEHPESFLKSVREFIPLIRKYGACPVLYETWGRAVGSNELVLHGWTHEYMQDLLISAYEAAASERGAILVRAGERFHEAYRRGEPVFDSDGSHPSEYGSRLIAETFADVLVRRTKIAAATPFSGAPIINLPSVYGAEPGRPFLMRVPVTGERPLNLTVNGLPDGLSLSGQIISGTVESEGKFDIEVSANNSLGSHTKIVSLEIYYGSILLTPLMGFSSWNAFASSVTQIDITDIAKRLISTGIAEYGYSYINTDSGWQSEEYGGEFDAIMPNAKFPDMKAMTDLIHSLGLKCGIYSSPMLTAWGCPDGQRLIPGCTQGERDIRFSSTNNGIGVIRKERNNAHQWEAWGFDYLKYDWAPTDPVNAELMRSELHELGRSFGFCVTVQALQCYWEYWSQYCQSYRNGPDSLSTWDNLKQIYRSVFQFLTCQNKGHFQDLDMLDFGTYRLTPAFHVLTEDEIIVAFSIRAFFGSPLQISSTLEEPEGFEISVYCNEEIIALNQDCAFTSVRQIYGEPEGDFAVFEKSTEDGGLAYAIFNMGETVREYAFVHGAETVLRDLWAKEDLASSARHVFTLYPHTVRILKTCIPHK